MNSAAFNFLLTFTHWADTRGASDGTSQEHELHHFDVDERLATVDRQLCNCSF